MKVAVRIEPLGVNHKRNGFSCGTAALDDYLVTRATQDIKRRIGNCFVAVTDDQQIAGFYTLAATSILLTDIDASHSKKLPRYPLVPAALVGRLAIDQRFQGKGLGGALIVDAAQRAANSDAAIYALVVDAKDAKAVDFYAHLGFVTFTSKPMSLYLSISTLLQASA
jgi:GNAT superfamily N-acetyltransferase